MVLGVVVPAHVPTDMHGLPTCVSIVRWPAKKHSGAADDYDEKFVRGQVSVGQERVWSLSHRTLKS